MCHGSCCCAARLVLQQAWRCQLRLCFPLASRSCALCDAWRAQCACCAIPCMRCMAASRCCPCRAPCPAPGPTRSGASGLWPAGGRCHRALQARVGPLQADTQAHGVPARGGGLQPRLHLLRHSRLQGQVQVGGGGAGRAAAAAAQGRCCCAQDRGRQGSSGSCGSCWRPALLCIGPRQAGQQRELPRARCAVAALGGSGEAGRLRPAQRCYLCCQAACNSVGRGRRRPCQGVECVPAGCHTRTCQLHALHSTHGAPLGGC